VKSRERLDSGKLEMKENSKSKRKMAKEDDEGR